jgi:hypothetical protein
VASLASWSWELGRTALAKQGKRGVWTEPHVKALPVTYSGTGSRWGGARKKAWTGSLTSWREWWRLRWHLAPVGRQTTVRLWLRGTYPKLQLWCWCSGDVRWPTEEEKCLSSGDWCDEAQPPDNGNSYLCIGNGEGEAQPVAKLEQRQGVQRSNVVTLIITVLHYLWRNSCKVEVHLHPLATTWLRYWTQPRWIEGRDDDVSSPCKADDERWKTAARPKMERHGGWSESVEGGRRPVGTNVGTFIRGNRGDWCHHLAHPIRHRHRPTVGLIAGPHVREKSGFKINLIFSSWLQLNSYKFLKYPGKSRR